MGVQVEDLSYHQKHKRLTKENGRPQACQFCGKQGEKVNGRWTIEWAKIHGRPYSASREDYMPLCHKCHGNYDRPRIE